MEQRVVPPQVVMMQIAQCWRCKQYLPPGAEIRVRTMLTAVEQGTGLHGGIVKRREPVSLCVPCDEAAAIEQQKEAERAGRGARWCGWIIGAYWMTICLHTIGLPWPLAFLGACGLIRVGILGRTILTLLILENVTELMIGQSAAMALVGPMTVAVVGIFLGAKYGWNVLPRRNLPAEVDSR